MEGFIWLLRSESLEKNGNWAGSRQGRTTENKRVLWQEWMTCGVWEMLKTLTCLHWVGAEKARMGSIRQGELSFHIAEYDIGMILIARMSHYRNAWDTKVPTYTKQTLEKRWHTLHQWSLDLRKNSMWCGTTGRLSQSEHQACKLQPRKHCTFSVDFHDIRAGYFRVICIIRPIHSPPSLHFPPFLFCILIKPGRVLERLELHLESQQICDLVMHGSWGFVFMPKWWSCSC